jgi:hypothetical protein
MLFTEHSLKRKPWTKGLGGQRIWNQISHECSRKNDFASLYPKSSPSSLQVKLTAGRREVSAAVQLESAEASFVAIAVLILGLERLDDC